MYSIIQHECVYIYLYQEYTPGFTLNLKLQIPMPKQRICFSFKIILMKMETTQALLSLPN